MSEWLTRSCYNHTEEPVKAENEIIFLGELLHLIDELQELVRGYINVLTSDQDGCMLEEEHSKNDLPF